MYCMCVHERVCLFKQELSSAVENIIKDRCIGINPWDDLLAFVVNHCKERTPIQGGSPECMER